jgi:hypothetical protein
LTDRKQKADIFWNEVLTSLPAVETSLVVHAMDTCNRADKALLDKESKEREGRNGPYSSPNRDWKKELDAIIRQIQLIKDWDA